MFEMLAETGEAGLTVASTPHPTIHQWKHVQAGLRTGQRVLD